MANYFGNKEQLFLASMQVPINPVEILRTIGDGTPDLAGERLVRTFLTVWDSPAGSAAAAMMRSAVSSEWGARMLREFVSRQILRRLLRMLDMDGDPHAPLRVALAGSQLVGLAMARYIVKVEPIASAPRETLVAAIAPTIQRYLRGDVSFGA